MIKNSDSYDYVCDLFKILSVWDILPHPYPDGKVHGVNMGRTWVLSAPDGPPVGIRVVATQDGGN